MNLQDASRDVGALHDALIGSWELQRFWYAWPDGREWEPLGRCAGQLHYLPNGFMSVQLAAREREPLGVAPTDDQLMAAFRQGFAYCGRWCWDERRQEVRHQVDVASIADWSGVTLARRVQLTGESLLLGTDAPNLQLPAGGYATWLAWQRLHDR
ncbi:lipocalin-like domain-containing protein [Cobetia sp. 5-25-4-2]|uniref:lipocalin-like domain-containing protein n=1 Tax=Cobetia TaxID=204286 RepID=UPI001596C398|nr:lipocalin-like domain-containing protein [Cobetia sp. 5-25-4-2]